MPRITQLLERNTNGVIMKDYWGEPLGTRITRSFHNDLADAVYSDHPCEDVSTCDIAHALDAGFVYSAACLLMSATECDTVSAVIDAHAFNGTIPADWSPSLYDNGDWEAWSEYHAEHTTECPACGSYIFDVDPSGDTCGNCLAEIPATETSN